MTKVSMEIMNDIQDILDIEIPRNQHALVSKLVEIIAKLVGSDEGIIEAIKVLQDRISKLEEK